MEYAGGHCTPRGAAMHPTRALPFSPGPEVPRPLTQLLMYVVCDKCYFSTMRGAGTGSSKKGKEKKHCLKMEDLVPALNDLGITIKKPAYYM